MRRRQTKNRTNNPLSKTNQTKENNEFTMNLSVRASSRLHRSPRDYELPPASRAFD